MPSKMRKVKFVVVLINKGRKERTNWIKAYKVDKLKLTQGIQRRYSTTTNEDIASKALAYARSSYPSEIYELGRA